MTKRDLVTNIDFETLRGIFRMPIEDAAKCLGVSVTVLKRNCRRHGVSRWPYRKIKSLDNMINAIESNPKNISKTSAHLKRLKAKREAILSGKPLPQELEPKQKTSEQTTSSLHDWDWNPEQTSSSQVSLFETSPFSSVGTLPSSVQLPEMKKISLPPISQLLSSLS